MKKKYKLTDEIITYRGRVLHRIEALYSFRSVSAGDKGGFIESEYNLSQVGDCWVYNEAKVYGKATVEDDASIYDTAEVYGNAIVCGCASLEDSARVADNAVVMGEARLRCCAKVFDDAQIMGYATIDGISEVYGYAVIEGVSSKIGDRTIISGEAEIRDAIVEKQSDYIVFKNWWSSGRSFTWTRSNNMWNVGCFYGTGEKLISKAYKDSELSGREYERIVRYVEAINQPTKRLNRIQRIVCKLFKIK